ncbi:hypothetical protein ACQP1G_37435 [Nocardia sp. CA-107356]|uniref:hypothetical protein n=1 Tax=Nocardia sp. CA-107356 TaxID=3239972 RepID=UPI003D8A54BD
MSGDHTIADNGAQTQIRFLRHVLDRLDTLMRDAAPWDGLRRLRAVIAQRVTVLADTDATDDDGHGGGESADPVIALITIELHRLRRCGSAATITTRGGHRHDRVHVAAVHRHHTVLHRLGGRDRVLLPLRFIEAVHPHTPASTDKEPTPQ